MGYKLVNGLIEHLYIPFRTTSNYRAIPNLHALQITTALTKHFPACCVFISHSLGMVLTFETLPLHMLGLYLHGLLCRTQFSTNWVTPNVFLMTIFEPS